MLQGNGISLILPLRLEKLKLKENVMLTILML